MCPYKLYEIDGLQESSAQLAMGEAFGIEAPKHKVLIIINNHHLLTYKPANALPFKFKLYRIFVCKVVYLTINNWWTIPD